MKQLLIEQLKSTIKTNERKADQLSEQISAVSYAKHLIEEKHKSAISMINDCPQNAYIKEWESEEQTQAKRLTVLDQLLNKLSADLDYVCNATESQRESLYKMEHQEELLLKQEKALEPKENEQKGYIVKCVIINNETGEKEFYYIGVDGYVHSEPQFCDPYKAKGNAKRRILEYIDPIKQGLKFENGAYIYTDGNATNHSAILTVKRA